MDAMDASLRRDHPKILQIISADNGYYVSMKEYRTSPYNRERDVRYRVVAWALVEDVLNTHVVPLIAAERGLKLVPGDTTWQIVRDL